MRVEQLAEVCHEINRIYCQSIGDDSQKPWDEALEWQRNSAILGVRTHIKNPGMTPENSHESWLQLKKEEGWKYGPVKDPAKKEHPAYLPYSDLPEQQKVKDFFFNKLVKLLKVHVE